MREVLHRSLIRAEKEGGLNRAALMCKVPSMFCFVSFFLYIHICKIIYFHDFVTRDVYTNAEIQCEEEILKGMMV